MGSITRSISSSVATSWEEGLIAGNGSLGAMLFGEPGAETVVLNRAGLFLPTIAPLDPPHLALSLTEVRRLIAQARYADAAALAVHVGRKSGIDGLIWTDPFVPAAYLTLCSDPTGRVTDYTRTIDLETGAVAIAYRVDGAPRRLELVASRTEGTLRIRLESDEPFEGLTVSLGLPPLSAPEQAAVDRWVASVRTEISVDTAESAHLTMRARFAERGAGSLFGYRVRADLAAPGSVSDATGGGAGFTSDGQTCIIDPGVGALSIVISVDLEREADGEREPEPEAGSESESAARRGFFRGARARAPADRAVSPERRVSHAELSRRCTLDLEAGMWRDETIENLQLRFSEQGPRNALFERLFAAGRSAIISATGELPPTLTGIWGGSWAPAWSGDYTANGNLQTAIEGLLPLGTPELMLAYFDYLESLLPDFRRNAERLYAGRGIYVPSRMSSHGLMNHYNETYAHIYWTAGAAWAAHFYFDYYRYTLDTGFLRDRALLFLTEAARFYEDFLATADPALDFSPSYSPENSPANVEGDVQVTHNAAMDIDLVRELFANITRAHDLLGIDSSERIRWEALLQSLPAYDINQEGAVSEWADPGLEDNYEHRHASHLYRLYYERPAVLDDDAVLEASFAAALRKRLEYRRAERAGTMAFGLVQLGHAAISLRDAEATEEILTWLADGYWTPALTSTHDRGSIFNTDICGGLPNLMARCLVDGNEYAIDLLPALPASWPTGRLRGVRLRGCWACDISWRAGRLERVALTSAGGRTARLRLAGRSVKIEAEPGQTIVLDGDLSPAPGAPQKAPT